MGRHVVCQGCSVFESRKNQTRKDDKILMKSFLSFSLLLLISSCTTQAPEQLEVENAQLKVTIDSLEIELERVRKEAEAQRAIAERQTEIALEQTRLAMQAADAARQQAELANLAAARARIAEDSAYAVMKRANELKK